MNRTDLIKHLRTLGACSEALDWIEETPGEPAELWVACEHGGWMMWLLVQLGYDERTLRHIACDCAEGALPIYERAHPDDRRPRDAIAIARRYADGKATEDEMIAASDAAWSASCIAANDAAMNAAWAARAAGRSEAIDAAVDAERCATWAVAGEVGWSAAHARHADMIRARVSWADVERAIAAWDALA